MDSQTTEFKLYGTQPNTKLPVIQCPFQFNEELYFLNERVIIKGKLKTFKGQMNCEVNNIQIELELYVTSGNMATTFWVNADECFRSKEALVASLLD